MTKVEKHKLYKDKIEICFDVDKHHYTINDETVDGVTSILGVINKPALIYWSANKAAEFVDLNLKVGVGLDELQKKKLVDGCKTAHKTLKTDAGDLGTMLHELIEKFAKKQTYDEPINAILKNSFEQFKTWVKENKVTFKLSEKLVYSKQYNYAGTLDLTGKVNGENTLIDIKTSSGIWDEYHLQVAAYRQALVEEFPKSNIAKTVILRCGKDGVFEPAESTEFEENFKAFLGALQLYRRLKEMKFNKRMGGSK